jgi:hypothetical protein
MAIRNINFFRQLPEGISMQEFGTRLYEALSDVQQHQNNIAGQTNSNITGPPAPPPQIDKLQVTGQNGIFHLQIHHAENFYRGVNYHVEYADNPQFQNPRSIDLGASREETRFLGNGSYYWRAAAAYSSSPANNWVYHGGTVPQPVDGGGGIGGPAYLPPQGSGTGSPGEGLSGPGPVAFRSPNGVPPKRAL